MTDLGDKRIEVLHGQRKRADTSSDRPSLRRPELGDKGLQGRGGHSSPELGDKCKGLQGRDGHSSTEWADTS